MWRGLSRLRMLSEAEFNQRVPVGSPFCAGGRGGFNQTARADRTICATFHSDAI